MKNIMDVMNTTRLEARLAPPEADEEAAEVRGPRRFQTLLSKTSARSILTSVRSKMTSASPT